MFTNKVLLVAPTFFGYHQAIENELIQLGCSVDYVPDRPSDSALFKGLYRIDFELVRSYIANHAEYIISKVNYTNYDLILFVGGISLGFSREQYLKIQDAAKCKLALYLWDALRNCDHIQSSIDIFDCAFSFEPEDCLSWGIVFQPLFYTQEYASVGLRAPSFEYDACYIGSVHQVDKFKRISAVVEELEKQGANVYTHFYMPSKFATAWRMSQDRIYVRKGAELRYRPLESSRIAEIYSKSKTIIDSPQWGQLGLTMRSIEALGARRRLITWNPSVVNYDFYDSGNVLVCGSHLQPCARFAASYPEEYPEAVWKRYSLKQWLTTLLNKSLT